MFVCDTLRGFEDRWLPADPADIGSAFARWFEGRGVWLAIGVREASFPGPAFLASVLGRVLADGRPRLDGCDSVFPVGLYAVGLGAG
jgi:hypothetical protein